MGKHKKTAIYFLDFFVFLFIIDIIRYDKTNTPIEINKYAFVKLCVIPKYSSVVLDWYVLIYPRDLNFHTLIGLGTFGDSVHGIIGNINEKNMDKLDTIEDITNLFFKFMIFIIFLYF